MRIAFQIGSALRCRVKLLTLLLLWSVHPVLYAQWPTSPLTDSALVINYGFRAKVITLSNGSSIFSHGLENTVFVQKFDPEGYRVWPGIVVAHDNDSSDFDGGALIVSDGNAGAVLGWEDHRGAYWDPDYGIYRNNAYYVQRVDGDGNVLWGPGGVLVAPPDSGFNFGTILTDGSGGAIYVTVEFGFGDYPNAPNRDRLMVARVGGSGQKLWDVTLESSTEDDKLYFIDAERAGRHIYVNYFDYRSSTLGEYFTWVIDTMGIPAPDSVWSGFHANTSWKDSILFSLSYPTGSNMMQKFANNGNTLWSMGFATPGNCQSPSPYLNTILVPDGLGGIYYVRGCRDTVLHFNSQTGTISRFVFVGIDSVGGYLFAGGIGDIVLANTEGEAQRYDSVGTPLWGMEPIVYQNDRENSYFEDFWGDNNGGIIATFWTTSHGLSAQHTGRYGQPGIVPVSEQSNEIPRGVELAQNYPNPFNPTTRIEYSLSRRATVKLNLYDVLGRDLSTLVNQVEEAGHHTLEWNGGAYPSGVYFYRLEIEGRRVKTRKMVLLR